MSYDKELIAGKLRRWEKYLERFWLPEWKELPDLGLYMDQVVKLLQDYLDYMPPEMKDGQTITAAAINNYVRIKVMPEPQKKRYYRVHIAYLIIICTLKQSLSIAFIQKFIPLGLSEDEVRAVYEKYALQHRKSAEYFVNQVRLAAADLLDHRLTTEMAVRETDELIAMSAVISGFSGLLAEKLLMLEGTGKRRQHRNGAERQILAVFGTLPKSRASILRGRQKPSPERMI